MKKIIIVEFAILFTLIGCVLYWMSRENYLLFHGIVEIFSVCIAFGVFLITVNSLKYMKLSYLRMIGFAYLFIGILDFLHTMSFKGMNVFPEYDFYANQLWVGARYMESFVLLAASIMVGKHHVIKSRWLITWYTLITGTFIYSVFYARIFPICFIAGHGQTRFKLISEYIIIIALLASMLIVFMKRRYFEKNIYLDFMISLGATVFSEASFTLYTDNYGVFNAVGHLFKVFSFYMIYRAFIMTGIKEPYNIIFKELTDARQQLIHQNNILKNMVDYDGLTKVHNKRYLLARLEELKDRYNRYQEPFVLLIIDVDDFKKINDTYGHTTGDRVLQELADLLSKKTRASDVVARFGGDEFVVLLMNTEKEKGASIANNLHQALNQYTFSDDIEVTASIGFSCYHCGSVEDIIDSAD